MDGRPAMKMMSSGKSLSNTRVRILDEHGKEVADKKIGEVALQSDCMLTEYYNRPDATTKALRDGWFLTGDYGYVSDGEVFVSGRKKDMIIVGGKNVYPQDLESLTYEVPGVHAGRPVAFGTSTRKRERKMWLSLPKLIGRFCEQEKIADAIRQYVTKNSAIALRYVKVVGPKWILKTSSGKTAVQQIKKNF